MHHASGAWQVLRCVFSFCSELRLSLHVKYNWLGWIHLHWNEAKTPLRFCRTSKFYDFIWFSLFSGMKPRKHKCMKINDIPVAFHKLFLSRPLCQYAVYVTNITKYSGRLYRFMFFFFFILIPDRQKMTSNYIMSCFNECKYFFIIWCLLLTCRVLSNLVVKRINIQFWSVTYKKV